MYFNYNDKNLMFYTGQNKFKLIARNEGKIKAYGSSIDVRAWSHDGQKRNCYLRDWMKCDMPICVIPVCTVANYLKAMTWKNRERVAPRCHIDCKSKAILDSICTSCHAIKECFRNEEEFEKYFEEEEFETCHWPCDKCLEALKSIKMFWKILIDKIFMVSVPSSEELESVYTSRTESIKNITKTWQDEIVHQALFVKKLSPLLSSHFVIKPSKGCNNVSIKSFQKRKDFQYTSESSHQDKATATDSTHTFKKSKSYVKVVKNISRCTSVKFKTVDVECNTSYKKKDPIVYYNDLDYVQQRFNLQNDELEHLKRENASLKIKLQNSCKTFLASSYSTNNVVLDSNNIYLRPFEALSENEPFDMKNIESEMIITLKDCKNEEYKHVSMLQVLHKTNCDLKDYKSEQHSCKKHEDPFEILTRVHNTFGEIVKREMSIVTDSKLNSNDTNINASYHRIKGSKSVPSCTSTFSPATSASKFVSTTDMF